MLRTRRSANPKIASLEILCSCVLMRIGAQVPGRSSAHADACCGLPSVSNYQYPSPSFRHRSHPRRAALDCPSSAELSSWRPSKVERVQRLPLFAYLDQQSKNVPDSLTSSAQHTCTVHCVTLLPDLHEHRRFHSPLKPDVIYSRTDTGTTAQALVTIAQG